MSVKLIASDLHLHAWSAFSEILSTGINTRLRIILNELEKACDDLLASKGKHCYIAGDLFHVRGSIAPSVLNPALDVFKDQIEKGIEFRIIPGNHDLETKHTDRYTNASQALAGIGCKIIHKPTYFEDDSVLMIPWLDSLEELKALLATKAEELDAAKTDVIIHAPMNGILLNIPETGLNADEIKSLGFRRVFCGHYHNAVKLNESVISVGSLTHQTWSDADTHAGYWLFNDKSVAFRQSDAPKFMDFDAEMPDSDCKGIYSGNYVRVKLGEATEKEIRQIRETIINKYEADGCIVQAMPKVKDAVRATSIESGANVLKSIDDWIKTNIIEGVDPAALLTECSDILGEVDGGEDHAFS